MPLSGFKKKCCVNQSDSDVCVCVFPSVIIHKLYLLVGKISVGVVNLEETSPAAFHTKAAKVLVVDRLNHHQWPRS